MVAKGYSQVRGIDYGKVFAPIVRFDTLWFLLTYAAQHDMELKQVDVKTAFLQGELDQELFMELPILPHKVVKKIV